jgi:alkylhydroperoxidase family enzyme
MFGVAVANLSAVDESKKTRYSQLYCGLCHALKERFGQVSRACLNYDLVFLEMILASLHESPETAGSMHCPTHLGKKREFVKTSWTDYAADLSVALAYNKFLDDVADEGGIKARAGEAALKRAYAKVHARRPYACEAIAAATSKTTELETSTPDDVEAIANVTGALMGYLFATGATDDAAAAGTAPLPHDLNDAPYFTDTLAMFGNSLGRFIYFMDAAVDFEADAKNGAYNAFAHMTIAPADARDALAATLQPASEAFERLPLLQDADLMSAVLYAGVWQKYNSIYEKAKEGEDKRGEGEQEQADVNSATNSCASDVAHVHGG